MTRHRQIRLRRRLALALALSAFAAWAAPAHAGLISEPNDGGPLKPIVAVPAPVRSLQAAPAHRKHHSHSVRRPAQAR
jgi:hypothetical protein